MGLNIIYNNKIHKIFFDQQPNLIMEYSTYSSSNTDNIQTIRKPMLIDNIDNTTISRTLLYKGLIIYNKVPDEMKYKNPKLFSKKIVNYIKTNNLCDKIQNGEYGQLYLPFKTLYQNFVQQSQNIK